MTRNLTLALLLTLFTYLPIHAQKAEDYFEKAKKKYELEDFQYASTLIDKAIELDRDNGWYWLFKAEIQTHLAEPGYAINYIHKAIAVEPELAEAYNRAGKFYSSGLVVDSAIYMYDQAIKYATKDSSKIYYKMNRGVAKLGVQDFKGARKDFEDVLEVWPDDWATLNNLAQVYKKMDMIAEAKVMMERTLALKPEWSGPYINLGLLYTEIDSYDLAIDYFNKASKINPNDPLLLSNRGFAFYKMGDYNKALNDVSKSLKLYKTNSFAYKNLALIYFAKGMKEEGCKALHFARYHGFEKSYGDEVNRLFEEHCED